MSGAETTMEAAMLVCAKCGGNGRYYFHSGEVGACYPCDGTGRVDAPVFAARRIKTTDEIVAEIAASADRQAEIRARLRNMFRNARTGIFAFEDLEENFPSPATNRVLALFPDALAAFRGLGWPV